MYIYTYNIYIKVYDTDDNTILRGIVYNNTNIYILVNSVINHANYLQLQKHYIKYSTSLRSYYTTYIFHLFYIQKSKKPNNPGYFRIM